MEAPMTLAAHAALISKMSEGKRLCLFQDTWSWLECKVLSESTDAESIVKAFERIGRSIPEDVLRKVPKDGSMNYRKYLYGQ